MTTYFVSSISGNNSNAGTAASDPLASLQAAEALVKPGDTVEVMNGTYTGGAPYGGDTLDITTSGTASAPITFEAAPGATPVIDSTGGWNAIKLMASYNVIEGFTVVGDAAKITLAEAITNYGTGNPYYDGNGIAIVPGGSTTLPNHDTIENNTVYNEPGGGIYTEGSDYVQILNNVVHDNAHWSAYGNSGISISTSVNLDTAAGAHIIVNGNTVYGNAQEVATVGGSLITDGEGIILDTNPNYTSEILVSGNTVHNNGSTGIEAYLTNNAVITDNTLYGDNTENVQSLAHSEIFLNQSTGDTVSGNTGALDTVAYYIANQSTLDASGNIAIADTAANVASAIATLNADTHVSAITLLGTVELDLTVAQALGDTRALSVITNSTYGIVINDSAANLDALSPTQIAQLSGEGVTELHAMDADLSLSLAQRQALAADAISVLQPHSGGTTEDVTYGVNGGVSSLLWLGVTGRTFTSRESVYNSAGALVANADNKSTGGGALTLFAGGLTISEAGNSLDVTVGADTFALDFHRRETINAAGAGSVDFNYAFGFGHQTINGFDAAAIGGDTLSLGLAMFSGLSILNTVAQDAAILLSSGAMAQSGSAVTITDKRGETITLAGETTTALIQSAGSVFKFV